MGGGREFAQVLWFGLLVVSGADRSCCSVSLAVSV